MKARYLAPSLGNAIVKFLQGMIAAKKNNQFIVDPPQSELGISMNMNTNVIIADFSHELLGVKRESYPIIGVNIYLNKT